MRHAHYISIIDKLRFKKLIISCLTALYIIIGHNTYGQLPTIDGHFCDADIWGSPAGYDNCRDANPPTADMGNLYLIDDDDKLYVGWQRCTNGSGTSTFSIRFDSDCDGAEDSYIYIEWDAIGSNCTSEETIYLSDGSNSIVIGTAIQGSYDCNGNNPDCSEAGKFVEWILDMNVVTEALISLNIVDPCACDCEVISLLDAVTLSGGSLTSSPKDYFDFFSFDYEYELNDCPDSDFLYVNESCINEELQFDGTVTEDMSPIIDTLYYEWDFGDGTSSTESTPTHTYNTPGTYLVTLQVWDKFRCTDQNTYPIRINPAISAQCTFLSDASCRGLSDGSASVTGTGGSNDYTYIWDSGETTSTATGLKAGIHSVTVSDANGCSDICNVTISEPPSDLICSAIEDEPAKCVDELNGQATVTASGGNGGYTYFWDNNEETATAINLGAGTHTVTVTDSKGCESICTVVITQPDAKISCTTRAISPVLCYGESNGSASVNVRGGNGANIFLWDNGETTKTAVSLDAGYHSVTVTDRKGCNSQCIVLIESPDELLCEIIEDKPIDCYGDTNGEATVTVTGGTERYSFQWDNGEFKENAVNLSAGLHTVTVTDINDCTTTCTFIINGPTDSVSCTVVENSPVICVGESNGEATVTPSGGNGNFVYLWDNNETTQTATALNTGVHTVTVTDDKGCFSSCSITINEPSDSVSCAAVEDNPVECYGETNGEATVTATGGNGGFTYLWDNNETTQTAAALNAGLHSVTVTDSKGCTSICSVTINEPTERISCSAIEDNPVVCKGESNGQATVSAIGGNNGYTYLWDNGETTATATLLNVGIHTVTVTDSKDCTTTCSITINEPSDNLSCTATEIEPVTCRGEATGEAAVLPQGGNGGYTYLWDNGETTATATALDAGLHTVIVTDSKNCTTSCTVMINEPQVLSCTVERVLYVECNCTANGSATVIVEGGNGGNTYLWSNGETTQTAVSLDIGIHTVVVTDSKGCETTCEIDMEQDPACCHTIKLNGFLSFFGKGN